MGVQVGNPLPGMSHTLLGACGEEGCGFGVVSVTMNSGHTVLLWGRQEGGGQTPPVHRGTEMPTGCLGANWVFGGWDCFGAGGLEVSQGFSEPMRNPGEHTGGSAPVGQEGRAKGFIDNRTAPGICFLLRSPK